VSFIPDLKPIQEFDGGYSIRAVAWLTDTQPFTAGPVSAKFLNVLRQHIEKAWQPFYMAGDHECELCKKGFLRQAFSSSFNLFIPSGSVLYFSPIMVEHYILAHGYQPPDEFIEAVIASPAQETPEYFQAVRPFAERWRLLQSGLRG